MRYIDIDMKEILVNRIMEEFGNDGKILRVINTTVSEAYVMAEIGTEYKLYKISTNYPTIGEIDEKNDNDPFDGFSD